MKRTTETTFTCVRSTLLLLLCFAAGCTETEVINYDSPVQQQQSGDVETVFNLEVAASETPVTRSITFTAHGAIEADTLEAGATLPAPDSLQTKSAASLPDAQEKRVAGLWIGQYNAAGTRLLSRRYLTSVAGTQLTVKLAAATNCKVWFVANAGDLGNVASEGALRIKTIPYASTSDGRPQSNLLVMTGSWTGTITAPTTTQQVLPTVELTRLAAKISFSYRSSGTGFSFTPTSVILKGAPDLSQIEPRTSQLATGVTYKEYTGISNPAGATMYWYLPENMAGVGTNTNIVSLEKEKTGQGMTNATYIELTGNAVQNGVPYENVTFRFYPGMNMNDYNIGRNHHFIMDIRLTGLDISDKRITVGAIPSITIGPAENLPPMAGGTKELQVTSRAGAVWGFQLPDWLSATIDGQTTPPGSSLANQGPCKVTFTATTNGDATPRSANFAVDLGNGTTENFTITQEGMMFTVTPEILQLTTFAAVRGTVVVTGTNGLPYIITRPGGGSGIDLLSPALGGTNTATGRGQTLTFRAQENKGGNLSSVFNIAIDGANFSRTVTVRQPADPSIVINEDILQSYQREYNTQHSLAQWPSQFPPFDNDGSNLLYGATVNLNPSPATMVGSYTIQVERGHSDNRLDHVNAKKYCDRLDEDGHTDWRLPTMIELYAMWNKCRGTNRNAADNEYASETLGTKFRPEFNSTANNYWSNSRRGGSQEGKCLIHFDEGGITGIYSTAVYEVRCVRRKL